MKGSNSIASMHADWLEAIAQSKSRKAFEDIFNYYSPRVKSFMLRNGATESEADEIVQTVMLTIWTKAHQYDRKKAAVSTWIFRIARNKRIDAHRRKLSSFVGDVELEPDIAGDDPWGSEQNKLDISSAMADLNSDQRAILHAAYYEGFTHSEIAKRFELPIGTVKSRIRLACQKLKLRLDTTDAVDATKISDPKVG